MIPTVEWNNLDLMSDGYYSLLEQVAQMKPDFMYSDPPWGEGNLKFWRTYNHTGIPATYVDFMNRFIDLAKHVKHDIFLEMGLRWEEQWVTAFGNQGIRVWDRWELVYGSKKLTNVLLRFGTGLNEWAGPDLNGMTGWKCSYEALKAVRSQGATQFVLEPCVGKGLVAKSCKLLGLNLLANEINPDRLAVAQAMWAKS